MITPFELVVCSCCVDFVILPLAIAWLVQILLCLKFLLPLPLTCLLFTSPLSLLIYPMKKNIGREGTRGKS
jgi:hypothetical protein